LNKNGDGKIVLSKNGVVKIRFVLCCALVVSIVLKLILLKMKECLVISSDLVVLDLVAIVVFVLETFEMESQKRSRRTIGTTI